MFDYDQNPEMLDRIKMLAGTKLFQSRLLQQCPHPQIWVPLNGCHGHQKHLHKKAQKIQKNINWRRVFWWISQ